LVWLRHRMYHVEPSQVEITHHEVSFEDLPLELDGFTICQVSDPHIAARRRNQKEIADAIRTVRADLYALTGDMIYRQSGIASFFRWFDDLGCSIRPAIAILGNAENKTHVRTEEVLRGLAARGVPVLNNSVHCFTWRGAEIQIVGVDDPH